MKQISEKPLNVLFVLLLSFSCLAQDKQSNACRSTPPNPALPPSLIVQVVDPVWSPLPGATVSISTKGMRQKCESFTDNDGNAKFWLAPDNEYTVEAELDGFKKKRIKHILIYEGPTSFPTAYVQVRLKLDESKAITVD